MILEIFADDLTKNDINKNMFRSSRAIIKNKDQVLLLYSKALDYYMLPGGRIEKGESPKECVIREVTEETGLTVNVLHQSLTIKEYYLDSSWESHFFVCELDDVLIKNQCLTDEEKDLNIEMIWMPYLDAIQLLDEYDSKFSKAINIMQREFLALTHSF